MLKENGAEYSLLEKIYKALLYSVLEYIQQISVLSHVNTEILILPESKTFIYYLGTPMLKINCSEYNLSEKIYNALFYSVLWYIQQLPMLSHVKYRNSIFKRIENNLNII